MRTVDIPQIFLILNIARLDKEVKTHALTVGHRIQANKDPEYDTAFNAAVNATDLTEDEILELTDIELDAIYNEIIKLSYPGIVEKMQEGEVLPLSEEEKEIEKKNS